jgi:hypothetical protein
MLAKYRSEKVLSKFDCPTRGRSFACPEEKEKFAKKNKSLTVEETKTMLSEEIECPDFLLTTHRKLTRISILKRN